MNTRAFFKGIIALLLLSAVIISAVSCDKLPFFGKDEHVHDFKDGVCDCGETDFCKHETVADGKCIECGEYIISKVSDILALGEKLGEGKVSTRRYCIEVTVKELTNEVSGGMTVSDASGEIAIERLLSLDGKAYSALEVRPDGADKLTLQILPENRGGVIVIKEAYIIGHEAIEEIIETPDHTEMTIAEAREAEVGTLVRVKGVVAQITYAYGPAPSGVILVDGTSSIYVYDRTLAAEAEIGNTVEIAASKTYWVLEDEKNNADKFGYKGSNQLENVILISNDGAKTDFDKSWIKNSTVKEIMDTPASEDITNLIFKVTALVRRVEGTGFLNYYLDDIDGVTGSYVYTQCSGGDFGWLDEFDGKLCTVYITAQNAKSSSAGCVWRFLPVAVLDEGYLFDTQNAAQYAVKYHGVDQILSVYSGDPALELITSVSSELLGFEGATLSYSSSDEDVVYFTTEDGKTILHGGEVGRATVTITGAYGGKEYSETVEVEIIENEEIASITVAEAIAAAVDSEVTVRGIVGPSVVNRNAFYLFGEDGSVISVLVNDVAMFKEIAIGNEIIVKGTREHFVDATKYKENYVGQATVKDAVLVANYYGSHEYSEAKFVTDMTVDDLRNLDIMTDYSTTVFVVQARIIVESTSFYTKMTVKSADTETTITLYCSGAGQYEFLHAYSGQTVTLELAGCNWNDKTYWTFCALAVVNEDGSKVYNTLNFDINK